MDREGIPDWMATGKDSLPVQTASEPAEQATVKQCLTVPPDISGWVRSQLESSQPAGDFDRAVGQVRQLGTPKPKRTRRGKKGAGEEELGYGR